MSFNVCAFPVLRSPCFDNAVLVYRVVVAYPVPPAMYVPPMDFFGCIVSVGRIRTVDYDMVYRAIQRGHCLLRGALGYGISLRTLVLVLLSDLSAVAYLPL